MYKKIATLGLAAAVFASPALANHHKEMKDDKNTSEMMTKSVALMNVSGEKNGSVEIQEGKSGLVMHVKLEGLSAGEHAIHVHETGDCSPSGDLSDDQTPFKNAGGHFNPTNASHGILSDKGPHAGDFPNFFAAADGTAEIELISEHLSLGKNGAHNLLDDDGSAIIVHQGSDDYQSQPSGDAGSRVACAVIK